MGLEQLYMNLLDRNQVGVRPDQDVPLFRTSPFTTPMMSSSVLGLPAIECDILRVPIESALGFDPTLGVPNSFAFRGKLPLLVGLNVSRLLNLVLIRRSTKKPHMVSVATSSPPSDLQCEQAGWEPHVCARQPPASTGRSC